MSKVLPNVKTSIRSVVLSQYLEHYRQERNHQGLGNRLIATQADWGRPRGPVGRGERLGGLLSYYYREAA